MHEKSSINSEKIGSIFGAKFGIKTQEILGTFRSANCQTLSLLGGNPVMHFVVDFALSCWRLTWWEFRPLRKIFSTPSLHTPSRPVRPSKPPHPGISHLPFDLRKRLTPTPVSDTSSIPPGPEPENKEKNNRRRPVGWARAQGYGKRGSGKIREN